MKKFLSTTLLIVCFSSSDLHACSCEGDSFIHALAAAKSRIDTANLLLIHARVERLLPNNSAKVTLVETFANPQNKTILNGRVAESTACGTTFRVGEEYIYYTSGDVISICGKFTPTPELLDSARKIRNAIVERQNSNNPGRTGTK